MGVRDGRILSTSSPGVCAGRGTTASAARRQAFTLIEVLLTLGVLVILASFAWPVLGRLAESERLSKAADRVRARWVGARASAIESGLLIAFRYAPGGNRFRVECVQDGSSDGESKPACLTRLPLEQTLPDGVRFAAEQGPEAGDEGFSEPAAEERTAADPGWSQPILFFPDGTCSNAQLELRNERDWSVQLSLRGMTGVASVSRPQSADGGRRLPLPGEGGPGTVQAEGQP
jgi:prepilin-type N-terminal cleavage/methylation domain-containing protein